MKIVLLTQWFSEKMGYSDNFLPKALAQLGHEVHLIATNGQVYFNSPAYSEVFGKFLGPPQVECGTKNIDGYTLHRLPYLLIGNHVYIKGLSDRLRSIRPDVVQTGEIISLLTYQTALAKLFLRLKMFIECHIHASVFYPGLGRRLRPLRMFNWYLYRLTWGPLFSSLIETCHPISDDAAEIVQKFWAIPDSRICIRSLGTDTDLFFPVRDEATKQSRLSLREKLGFKPGDIVCIYTGRLEEGKKPLCLAQAIDRLVQQGKPFRGLFIGDGSDTYCRQIRDCAGCQTHPFVFIRELPLFYRAADIAVWPAQESTSQLDAAACGLPLILSDRVRVKERVNGNGLLYQEGNSDDLADKLMQLFDAHQRHTMGQMGAKNMQQFSWHSIAEQYIQDYQTALSRV